MKHRSGFGKKLPLLCDLDNRAKCPSRPLSQSNCDDIMCPKHNPIAYAHYMAAHRKDMPGTGRKP